MTTYNTGNPLGSTAVKDLYDNAQNLDYFSNGQGDAYPDRFAASRLSLAGIRNNANAALLATGYEFIGDYDAVGELTFTRVNQLMSKSGEYWKPGPSLALPYTTVNNWAIDQPKFVSVGDAALRTALASAIGSTLVGDGASTVADELAALRSQVTRTVEYYGAVGDGVTDDKPAFLAMIAATGGYIRLLDKAYNVNGLALSGSMVAIIGKTKPAFNSLYTQTVGGSILVGNVNVRTPQAYYTNFSVDSGSAWGIMAADGFVSNAPVGQRGTKITSIGVVSLGANEVSDSHAILYQGYDINEVSGSQAALHQFGVVVKGRNGFIRDTFTYRIRTAPVYPKSDVAAFGGDVLDASVSNIVVDGVVALGNPANTTANAVYVHASTLSLSNVTVSNVQSTYGNAGLRIAGGSDTSIVPSGITFSNIKSERSVCGVDLFGYNYDVIGSNVLAINPTSGEAVKTSGNSYNYFVSNINTLISDPAITATSCASFNGVGGFDNFTVRNPYRQMIVNLDIANSVAGAIQGDAKLAGTGTLTLANGWTAGTRVPVVLSGARNLISCRGWAMAAGSSSNTIATFPLSQSPERFFSCAARKTDSTYTTVVLYLSGTSLILQGDRTALTYIDLSGVMFQA